MTPSYVRLGASLIALAVATGLTVPAAAQEAPAMSFSPDKAVSAQQHQAYNVVHRYEFMLSAGSTGEILKLFAPDSVTEWDKKAFKTRQQKAASNDALFNISTFNTVSGYDAIDVHGG